MSDPETITFIGVPTMCPDIKSSSGYSALVEGTVNRGEWTCTYNVELLDDEDSIETLIDEFVPNASGPEGIQTENERCLGQKSSECARWQDINNKVLKNYCQGISYFSSGSGGECRNYETNPFNPFLPQSKGCNKVTNPESICSNWMNTNYESGGLYTNTVNTSGEEYCDTTLTPDCACLAAPKSLVFQEVTAQGVSGETKCWWRPCQLSSQGTYLIPHRGVPKCDEQVCINVNNIFFQNDDIGGNVVVNELNACGSKKPDNVLWYEQWWFWIIVLTIIVILLATFIYFASKV